MRCAHPLVYLAEQKLTDFAHPDQHLGMEALLKFLAEETGQTAFDIDPLKINVAAVSDVMSKAFAVRHRILAVAVSPEEVVVASAEPLIDHWEADLAHVAERPIRQVLADPQDIARHTEDFYSMATSVRVPTVFAQTIPGRGCPISSRCLSWAGSEPDANDQHIIGVVDWLLQYAFEQRASDIHIEPRRTWER